MGRNFVRRQNLRKTRLDCVPPYHRHVLGWPERGSCIDGIQSCKNKSCVIQMSVEAVHILAILFELVECHIDSGTTLLSL